VRNAARMVSPETQIIPAESYAIRWFGVPVVTIWPTLRYDRTHAGTRRHFPSDSGQPRRLGGGPFQQLPIMFDLEAKWAVGVEHNPTLLDRYPRFFTLPIDTQRYLNTVDGQKHLAANGFQSDDFPTAENSNAGGDRASSRFSGLSRHQRWIPANI